MKRASLAVFVLLPALLAFGRNVTEQDIAIALKRALRTRDNLSDSAEVQVSSALATGKDICIEYRASSAAGQTISGLAVYRTEDDLVFLDNSWIWERACLSGKYGQRRNGKDVTRALNASLAAPAAAKPVVVAAAAVSPVPANVSVTSPTTAMIAPATPKVIASTPTRSASPQSAPAAITSVPSPVVAAVVPVREPVANVPVSMPVPVSASAVVSAAAVSAPVSVIAPARTPAPPPAPTAAPAPPVVVAAAPSAPVAAMPTTAVVTATVLVPVAANVPAPATPPAPAPARMAAAEATVATVPPLQSTPVAARQAPVMSASASTPVAMGSVGTPIQQMSAPPEVAIVSHLEQGVPPSRLQIVNPAASVETPLHGVTISDDNGALGPPTSSGSQSAPPESLADAARRVRRGQ